MNQLRIIALLAAAAVLTVACGDGERATGDGSFASPETGGQTVPFELTSTAFTQGDPIPTKYTCDGQDVSPPLRWKDPPEGTQSFALINDDPDAPVGTWVHWVLYNLPGSALSLPEAVPSDAELPDGSRHGQNS